MDSNGKTRGLAHVPGTLKGRLSVPIKMMKGHFAASPKDGENRLLYMCNGSGEIDS